MFSSERDLEDYICNNQDVFIKKLKELYGENNDIKFIGRQIRIGERNIADLLYYYDELDDELPFIPRTYIIVELKFRNLEAKDLGQLSRYINVLYDKLQSEEQYSDYETNIKGVFVSFGSDDNVQEIIMSSNLSNIDFLRLNCKYDFCEESYSYKEEYIDNLVLDERIEKLYKR